MSNTMLFGQSKFLAALFLLALVLAAEPVAAADTNLRISFKGPSASAFFSSTDASGCTSTDVSAFASDSASVTHDRPGVPDRFSQRLAFVAITQFDACNFLDLIAATCSNVLPLEDHEFVVVMPVRSAALSATLECTDFISGAFFDVRVDMTWDGIGKAERVSSHQHFRSPGNTHNSRTRSLHRSADVSGTVSDGARNFISGAPLAAQIELTTQGSLTLLREPR